MPQANQEKPSSKSNDAKTTAISKINIGVVKNGRITSEAPAKPEKPSKPGK